MEQYSKPKWQQEVEAMLNQRYQGDELREMLNKVQVLVTVVRGLEVHPDNLDGVVALMLNCASQELGPRAGAYLGFQLGQAYEIYLKLT